MHAFTAIAILSLLLPTGDSLSGHLPQSSPVSNFDYLCRNNQGLGVCHPISEKKFIHCVSDGPPLEYSCRPGLKFSSVRQRCAFPQYGDCVPDLTPDKAEKIKCPELKRVEDGKFHCSNAYRYQSLCLLACRPGYKRQGILALKCILAEGEGRWSGKPAKCVSVKHKDGCSLEQLHAKVPTIECQGCKEDHCELGAKCLFKCALEQSRDSISRAVCKNNSWTFEVKACVPVVCRPLKVTNGAVTCTDNYSKGSTCSVKCHEGSVLQGDAEVSCSDDGKWSDNLGKCTKSCPSLERANGNVRCSDGYLPQSSCQLTCNEDHFRSGDRLATCESSGEWANELGVCLKEVSCSRVETPKNGNLFCSDSQKILHGETQYPRGSVCHVSCNNGFSLNGSAILKCSDSGSWVEKVGVCVSKCNKERLPAPKNGRWECKGQGDLTCHLKCDTELVTKESSVSCIDGVWSMASLPKCDAGKRCSSLTPPHNSYLSCNTQSLRNGTRCSIACKKDFHLSGASSTHCVDGKWHNALGQCKAKCSRFDLEGPSAGRWDCRGFDNLSCKLSCKDGYEPHESTASCSDGVWTKSSQASCLKTCPLISAPANGALHCTCTLHHHVSMDVTREPAHETTFCKTLCDDDYKLVGPLFTNCTSSGDWTSEVGSCRKGCNAKQLAAVENGFWICKGKGDDLQCALECKESYRAEIDRVGCLGGVWNIDVITKPPKCVQSFCPLIPARSNGKITCIGNHNGQSVTDPTISNVRGNSACRLDCAPSHSIHGSEFTFCSEDGKWDKEVGVCTGKCEAGQVGDVENGDWICEGSGKSTLTCRVRCKAGFKAKDSVSAVCSGGAWTKADVSGLCVRDKPVCPSISERPNGAIRCLGLGDQSLVDPINGEVSDNTACQLTCSEGLVAVGKTTSFCSKGTWDTELGNCSKVCSEDQLRRPSHGSWNCNGGEKSMVCELKCNFGFEAKRSHVARCSGGIWTNEKVSGICVKTKPLCPLIKDRRNGVVRCMALGADSGVINPAVTRVEGNTACELMCDSGFQIRGPTTTVCRDGIWGTEIGQCGLSCDENLLSPPSRGVWRCGSKVRNAGSESMLCALDCDAGYDSGSPVAARCFNGEWTYSERSFGCSKVSATCPLVLSPANGILRCSGDAQPAKAGTSCMVVCNEGYKIKGSLYINCTNDGIWDGTVGQCLKNCGKEDLPSVEFGSWVCRDTGALECKLTCRDGYDGSIHKVVCASGFWNMDVLTHKPICKPNRCPKLPSPPNGKIVCTQSDGSSIDPVEEAPQIYSACRLTCDSLFILRGSDLSFCSSNGKYEGTLGACRATCSETQLMPIFNGKWVCVGAGSLRCEMECNPGYESNNVRATCTGGVWSSHPNPTCVKVKQSGCTALPEPANGRIVCSNPQLTSGSTCALLCDDEYSLSGTAVNFCTGSGSWSSKLGQCVGSEVVSLACDQSLLPIVSNGIWECSATSCSLKCDDSFSTDFVSPVLCQSGVWNMPASEPVCLRAVFTSTSGSDGNSVNVDHLNGCITPRLDEGASLSCKSASGSAVSVGRTVSPGSNCELNCSKRFYVHGQKTAYCGPTGAWAARLGSCRPICTTTQLDYVENGEWSCRGVAVLSCTLKCKPGYEGEAAPASCDGGAWVKPINPKCRPNSNAATTSPESRPELPDTPLHRSRFPFTYPNVPKRPVVTAPEIYCDLPIDRPSGNLQCPKESNGRVPVGGNCFLKCKDSFKTKTKCTTDGWVPQMQSLSCPKFTLYTYEAMCQRPTIQHGSLDCSYSGSEIPANGECKLKCDSGYAPTWATQARCLDKGYWDKYLSCVPK